MDNMNADWQDKLKTVLDAMGMGAKAAVSPLMPSMNAPSTPVPAALNPLGTIKAPVAPVDVPPEPMPTPPPAPAPVQAAPTPPAAPQMAAKAPDSPSADDLLSQITNGDNDKMAALLEHLKDQDKRSQWAQALGVIGDTFGNMGQAKAGQKVDGFTSQKMLSDMNQTSKKDQLDNLTLSIANDPMSSTSKMAQMTLLQSMGIKPGDPRAAKIQGMSARAITGIMPQLTDAVKNQIEREKLTMEGKKTDVELGNQNLARRTAADTAAREDRKLNIDAAQDVLKNTSSWRDLVPGKGPRDDARATLTQGMGGQTAQVKPLTATNKMGHKIVSTDGGHTWKPAQ